MADFPENIPTDNAIDFQNSSNAAAAYNEQEVDGTDTEDPMYQGQTSAGRLDMFRAHPWRTPVRTIRYGNSTPLGSIPNLTPGARRVNPTRSGA